MVQKAYFEMSALLSTKLVFCVKFFVMGMSGYERIQSVHLHRLRLRIFILEITLTKIKNFQETSTLDDPLAKIVEAGLTATLNPHQVITLPNLITNYLQTDHRRLHGY